MIAPGRGESNRRLSASAIRALRKSVTMMKSIGESGSPYLSPRAWQIHLPVFLLAMIFVLAEESIKATQSVHRGGNPMCRSSSCRKGHATVSNALAMSTLSKADAGKASCTERKLSWTPSLEERALVAYDNLCETWREAHGQPLGECRIDCQSCA